jgi:serine/threonine protein phosphatase PrpC
MQPNTDESARGFASEFFVTGSSPINVEFGAASHTGLARSSNEDHFAIFRRIRGNDVVLTNLAQDDTVVSADKDEIFGQIVTTYLLVVADGMGEAGTGETASRVVIQRAFDLTDQASSWVMRLRSLTAQQAQERIDAYLTEMRRTLRAMGQADPGLAGMETTWTSAHIIGWNTLIVQIGDSRAYLSRRGELRQITRDQPLGALIDRGVPSEETGHARTVLTNTLGGQKDFVSSEIAHLVLEHGDRLLLCTDGLTTRVSDPEIAEVLGRPSPPQGACDALVKIALDRGGKDNVTVILADITRPCSP